MYIYTALNEYKPEGSCLWYAELYSQLLVVCGCVTQVAD